MSYFGVATLGGSHLHLLSRLDRNLQLHLRGLVLPLDPVNLLAVVPDSVGDLAQLTTSCSPPGVYSARRCRRFRLKCLPSGNLTIHDRPV